MKVVLVADLHLGYNIGVSQITKMVDKINAEDPDLVVIAGDIFDNEYEALEDPDALIALFRQMPAMAIMILMRRFWPDLHSLQRIRRKVIRAWMSFCSWPVYSS